MTLYEIKSELMDCVDFETGEITNFEKFENLQIAKDEKLENIAKLYKNSKAEADAISEEIRKLTQRKKSVENLAEHCKNVLSAELNGEKFKTPAVSISFRKSETVVIDNVNELPSEMVDVVFMPKKSIIKDMFKAGTHVTGARLETNNNIIIR